MENRIKAVIHLQKDIKDKQKELEESISLEDFKTTYSYEDKETLNSMREAASNEKVYWLSNLIDVALKELKIEAYPEINGVRYYKKYLDNLKTEVSEDVKIQIDRSLYRDYHPRIVYGSLKTDLRDKENDVLKELFEMGVISPAVHYPQMCDCWSGSDTILGNRTYSDTVYEFLSVEEGDDAALLEALDERGICCDNCGYEHFTTQDDIELIKDQYNNCALFRFKVIAEPDTSLDEI